MRDLKWSERWGFLAVTAIGFSYLINERLIELAALTVSLLLIVGWVVITRTQKVVVDN